MIRPLVATAGLLVLGGLVLIAQERQAPTPSDQELSSGERDLAARLARQGLDQRALVQTGPLVLSRVELLRDKTQEEKGQSNRQALVTHYRYQGDLTIQSAVDLTSQRIISVDTASGVPAPLAEEEFTRARKLALADPAVRRALGDATDRVTVEPLLVRSADPKDPLFHHRLVRLLFRLGQDYLTQPVVMVDLSDGRVQVQTVRR
jgi:Cu2+-containing amine oxidase